MPDNDNGNVDAWLKALGDDNDPSKHQGDDVLDQANRIGKIVRAEQNLAEESIVEDQLDHAKERLMFRLAQERIIDRKRPRQPGWWQRPLAMAASIAVVGMLALLTYTNIPDGPTRDGSLIIMSYGEIERMRGLAPEPFVVMTENPEKDATDLAKQLQVLQVPFELRFNEERADVRLLQIQFDGVMIDELRKLGFTQFDNSVVYIEFVPTD